MAKMNYIQNGVTKAKNGRRRKRRRNPATTTAKAAPRRNGVTAASAKAYAKRNGLKLVSKAVSNPRHKRRKRRNGIAASPRSASAFSRNGIFGKTKNDAKQVGTVLLSAGATKMLGRIIANFAAPYAAQVGVGQYAQVIVDAAIALVLAPMIGKHAGVADNARLGGLLIVGLDVVELFAPSALAWSPFNTSPVVLNGSQPLVMPQAVTQLVASTSATPAEKAKVAGAMAALQSGAGYADNYNGGNVNMLPMYE